MHKFLITLFFLAFLSACSVYRTNTDLSFSSPMPQEDPAITTGTLDMGNENFDYLGWVEAKVTRRSPLNPSPTEHQGNIVLAHLGQALGADAVTFVSYKTSMLGNSLFARGQAVRFKHSSPNHPDTVLTTEAPIKTVAQTPKKTNPHTHKKTTVPVIPFQPKHITKKDSAVINISQADLTLMASNAEYLLKQAKSLNRKDLELSATLLLELINKAKVKPVKQND